jgi:predicted phage terminase large subunit-like protein
MSVAVRELLSTLLQRRRSFNAWLKMTTPNWQWDWAHLVYIQRQLDRVTRGECRRLLVTLPPRHGKSELVTVRYSAWRLERDPGMKLIIAGYNSQLAHRFSRRVRRIAEQRIPLAPDAQQVESWETQAGGGCRAVGVGAGITGFGADLVVIDDPTKSREEANSESYRERVFEWFQDDLYTRLEPGAAMIVIATRWHESDLVGQILASDDGPDWTLVNLPAFAEANDPLGRKEGEALCRERYDEAALEGIRKVLGSSFSALYQGRPVPLTGGMFQRAWFPVVNTSPIAARRVRFWDKAGSAGKGDYTVGVLMSRTEDGMNYVEDIVRGQWSAHEREMKILAAARRDGASVPVWFEQEPGSGGKDSAAASIANLAGFVARAETATGDKATRAEPFSAQCEAGTVRLVRAPWNQAYIDELCAFPFAAHDDCVDASSGAFNKLAKPGVQSQEYDEYIDRVLNDRRMWLGWEEEYDPPYGRESGVRHYKN